MSKVESKWDALSTRERSLVLITAVVVPIVLIYIVLIEPSIMSLKQQQAKLAGLEASIASQNQVLTLLKAKEPVDPNIAAREGLKRLRLELTQANDEIRRAATNLVSPDQMLAMLRDVLKGEQGVALVSARSLAIETLQLGAEIQKIEQLEGVFFWDTLTYKVDQYPTAKVKIRVHTLSSEARWLGA